MEYPPTVNNTNAVWKDLFASEQEEVLKDIDQMAVQEALFGLSSITTSLNFKVLAMTYIQSIAYKVVQPYTVIGSMTLDEILVTMEFETFRELFASKDINIQSMLDAVDLTQY